jgi:hypothetical protein
MKVPRRQLIFPGIVPLFVFLGVFTSWSTASSAQVPTSTKPDSAVPTPTLTEGDHYRDQGDLTSALRIYRAVQTQQDSRDCQQRIAETEDRLEQFGPAYVEYARLLDRFGAELEPRTKGKVEARLRKLDELTGILALDPLLPKALVRIDGRVITEAQLARPLRVTRGQRRIVVEQLGYRPVTLTETIGVGMTRVTLPLEPIPLVATFHVKSLSKAPADLYVDGKNVGALPQRLELTPGEHTVYAEGPTVITDAQKVILSSNAPQELSLNFRDKPAIFNVDPVAPDAQLFVDEKLIGVGARSLELSPGKHTLELRRSNYRVQKLALEVKAGQKNTLRAGPYIPERTNPEPTPLPPVKALVKEASKPPLKEPKKTSPESAPKELKAKENPETIAPSLPNEESQFQGFFGTLFVPVMLGGDSTHSYVNQCPAEAYSGACTTTAPRGGGLGLRMGYFYEWVGLELFSAGAIDVSTAELKLPPIPTISPQMQDLAGRNVFIRAGGLLGGGIRIATPIQGIRVSVGADYVYVYRKVIAIPDSFAGASLGYSVPGWFFDGGIQLGSTPGARFYLGAFLFIESAHTLTLNRDLSALGVDPTLVPAELKTLSIYQGRQYFFGPILGISFGH